MDLYFVPIMVSSNYFGYITFLFHLYKTYFYETIKKYMVKKTLSHTLFVNQLNFNIRCKPSLLKNNIVFETLSTSVPADLLLDVFITTSNTRDCLLRLASFVFFSFPSEIWSYSSTLRMCKTRMG